MRDRLEAALRASDAEYTDIRIEDTSSSWVSYRGEELDSIGSSKTRGGIVRALVKGGWGYATFNDLSDLETRAKEASESARLVSQERSYFAPAEPVVDEIRASLVKDYREVALAEKVDLLKGYNRIILGHHDKIQTSDVGYRDTYRSIWYANSDGTYIADEQPDVWVFAMATARDGDNVQQTFEWNGGPTGFQLVEGFHEQAEAAAKRAVDLLSAPPVTGGKYTVVMDPFLAGVFIHEAFGHLSESDFVYENERLKELMVLGKRFGPEMLNVIDDGARAGALATHKYDFEGVPTSKTYLIRDGMLVGRLHSRETAARMGETPTGNARSVGYEHPPIVRMTNTYIDKGEASFEEMIGDIPLGVYAVRAIGGQTELEMFTFSAGWGYMIRDGQLAERVRDVVLTGNVFETLANVDMLSDTVSWAPGGPGGCGKGGQAPLITGLGAPHVRAQNVVVGGRQ
jgi:TldD protein